MWSLIGLLTLTAICLFTDFYHLLLPPLNIGQEIENGYGEVILVLGGGMKKGRTLGYSTEERLQLAADLFRKKNCLIVISGGSLYQRSPAIKMIKDFFRERGVAESFLYFEGKAQTTFDNFFYALRIIETLGKHQVIVVTSPYHQRRSRIMLNYMGYNDFRIARMADSEIYQSDNMGQRLRNIRLIMREYFAILKFKVLKK